MSCLDVPKGVNSAVVCNRGQHVGPSARWGLLFARGPRAATPNQFPIPAQLTSRTRVAAAFPDFR